MDDDRKPDSLGPERRELDKLSDDELIDLLLDHSLDPEPDFDDSTSRTLIMNILRSREYNFRSIDSPEHVGDQHEFVILDPDGEEVATLWL